MRYTMEQVESKVSIHLEGMLPRKGELYKHKQISDVVYQIDEIDSSNKAVYLVEKNGAGGRVRVTFTQLSNSYKKV